MNPGESFEQIMDAYFGSIIGREREPSGEEKDFHNNQDGMGP
jgi:hypothetical protein